MSGGKKENGSNNDKTNTPIAIVSKVKGEDDNRTYSSPTVLDKVLAWCLSLCSGRQDGAACAKIPAYSVFGCGSAHL